LCTQTTPWKRLGGVEVNLSLLMLDFGITRMWVSVAATATLSLGKESPVYHVAMDRQAPDSFRPWGNENICTQERCNNLEMGQHDYFRQYVCTHSSASIAKQRWAEWLTVFIIKAMSALIIEAVAPLKRRSVSTRLHGATSQKTVIFIIVKTSYLSYSKTSDAPNKPFNFVAKIPSWVASEPKAPRGIRSDIVPKSIIISRYQGLTYKFVLYTVTVVLAPVNVLVGGKSQVR
jgi:hypothetical protein